MQHRMKKIEQLKRQAAKKAEENANIEQQLSNIQVTVAERRHIYEATATGSITVSTLMKQIRLFSLILGLAWCLASAENDAVKRQERHQEIIRKNLRDLARTQAEDLAFLGAEVERLRMKNFPSLDQLKHK